MTKARSLDNLKMKELVAIAESLSLKNWRRLHKSELRDFILQHPSYANLEEKESSDATRDNALESTKPREKIAVKAKDDSSALEKETSVAKSSNGKGKKNADSAKETVVSESHSKQETNVLSSRSENASGKSSSKTKKGAKTVKAQLELKKTKNDVKAEERHTKKRSVEETVVVAMKEAAQTVETETTDNVKLSETSESKTTKSKLATKKTSRKRVVKDEAFPLLNLMAEESLVTKETPVEKKSRKDDADLQKMQTAEIKPEPETATESRKKVEASREKESVEDKPTADEKPSAKEPTTEARPTKATKRTAGKKRATKTEKDVPETLASAKSAVKESSTANKESEKSEPSKKPTRITRRFNDDVVATDWLRLSVCNSYWLLAQWNVSDNNLRRVRSAMERLWHTAEPILRVYRVDKEPQIASVRRERLADVPVKLAIRCWYVPVENPPCAFMLELGYNSRDGKFFTLASSNVVDTPPLLLPDSPINMPSPAPIGFYEEASAPKLPFGGATRTMNVGHYSRPLAESDGFTRSFSSSKSSFGRVTDERDVFQTPCSVTLSVDAEIVVKGRVSQGASVKIRDEKLKTQPDGSFSVRLKLPERRHVFPVVATSFDDTETQTIILAIDRNTKTLDPIFKEDEE